MVKIEKDYVFDGSNGKQSLKALFDGRRQLIVYHFMFDPAWDKGCPGCTSYVTRWAICQCSTTATRLSCSCLAPRSPSLRPTKRKGMERPVVFLVWQRFQLRLSRDERREGRADRIQLSRQDRVGGKERPQRNGGRGARPQRFLFLDDDVFHTYSVYAVVLKHSPTPTTSSTRHPMGGSRTLRTRPPVGLRSRPTGSPREVGNDKRLARRRATLAAGAGRDVGRGCVPIGFFFIRMSVGGTIRPIVDCSITAAIGARPGIANIVARRDCASRAEEFHPRALPEPYVNLSIHTAPDVRPLP